MWHNRLIINVHEGFALSTFGKLCISLVGVYSSYVTAQHMYTIYRRAANCTIRRIKQEENAKSIRDLAKHLETDSPNNAQIAYITKLSLQRLVHELKEGSIRPIEVLKAYQYKALDAHEKTNCLVEVITQAEEWALQLEKGPREGALWGVPISIKDDVGIKGYDSTVGMVLKIGAPSLNDSDLVKVLRKEGAIPFVKTNVPQTELSFEPGNPINGIVHNPHRHGYGPGGSSSGEAALIASGGSLLGIGSDLGGSIRVPAHFCGVFGFKPTPERMSTRGMSLDESCVSPVKAVWGPLSRDMDSIVMAMNIFWKEGTLAKADSEVVPFKFNDEEYTSTRKLRVGYYTDNGMTPTFSACVRAVEEAKRVLMAMGHEVVPWQPPKPDVCSELMTRVVHHDGGLSLKKALKYDYLHPTVQLSSWLFVPIWQRRIQARLTYSMNRKKGSSMDWKCGTGDVASYDELIYEVWQHRRLVQDSWNEAELDAVICPPHVVAAPPFGNAKLLNATYNILHFPAGMVPVTQVLQTDVNQLHNDFPHGNCINDMARHAMADSVDLPVGVMVAASKYQDETCLRVMKILEEGLKKVSSQEFNDFIGATY